MNRISTGDLVRFQPNSALPEIWKMPRDALGTVSGAYSSPKSPSVHWIDVDFGLDVGSLWGVNVQDFRAVRR